MMKFLLNHYKWPAALLIIAVVMMVICNITVTRSTANQHFSIISEVPSNDVGVVLGTSKDGRTGINLYFKYRLQAAAKLYHEGKVKHLLVSGDNSKEGYDEPTDMMEYLMELGVPRSAITRDYAGLRTLDSIIRAKAIFGQQKFTIVSQQFHNQRALFIANHNGIDAVAFNARNVKSKTPIREYLARVAAVLDVLVWDRQPKFLGKAEYIEL